MDAPPQPLHGHLQAVPGGPLVELPVIVPAGLPQPFQPVRAELELLDDPGGVDLPGGGRRLIPRHPQLLFPAGAGRPQQRHREIHLRLALDPASPLAGGGLFALAEDGGHVFLLEPPQHLGQTLQPAGADAKLLVEGHRQAPGGQLGHRGLGLGHFLRKIPSVCAPFS